MASWGQTGTAARAAVGVGGAVAVAAVAWWMTREAPEPNVTEPVPAAGLVAPEAAPVVVPEAAPAPQPLPEPVAAAPTPPSFDVVRIEADGAAQVAGRGAPDARILLLVDGAQVAEAAVAGDGAFAALFTLAPNPAASLLSLVMEMPDGTRIPGRETVALAPVPGPVVAAAVAVPEAPAATALPEPAVTPEPATPEPVTATNPPAALLVTEQGVEVLQAPAAALPGAVSIDTISYTVDGHVQFGGRGEAAHVVRLYLDNAALAEVAIPAGGQWGVTKADIAPGLYTLRADQVDSAGKVTSRFETPFKRETIAALAASVEAPAPDPAPAPVPAPVPEVAEVAAPEAAAPSVAAPEIAAPAIAEPSAAEPEVVAAADPAPVASPDPLVSPPPAASPPSVGASAPAPTVEPAVEPATAAQPTEAAPPLVVPDPAPAPEPTVVAVAPVAPVADAPAADPAPAPVASPVSITVQPGLTLWAIAEANFGEGIRYVQVYEANKDKIRDPDLIYPGQVFTVPAEP